jgi:hypothetical protein
VQIAVDQGWLTQNAVDRSRLPRPVEQPDEDRAVTPEEWAQIRINLSGEGTLLMCDLTLDCGLRYEEVTALRPVDVIDGDARNTNHRLGPACRDLGGPRVHRLDGPVVDRPDEGQALPQGRLVSTRVRPASPLHRQPSARRAIPGFRLRAPAIALWLATYASGGPPTVAGVGLGLLFAA